MPQDERPLAEPVGQRVVVRREDHRPSRITPASTSAPSEPRLASGSSRTRSFGSWRIARAIARRCCMPRESCPADPLATPLRPTIARVSATRERFTPCKVQKNSRFSAADSAWIKPRSVRDKTDPAAQASSLSKGVESHDLKPARGRARGRGKDAKQGRLPGAVLTEHGHVLASVDREVDRLERDV